MFIGQHGCICAVASMCWELHIIAELLSDAAAVQAVEQFLLLADIQTQVSLLEPVSETA